MNIAFYTATSGMIAQQEGMNIYSNNIANVNTVGFKAERPSFADCVYTIQKPTEPEWETGHGQYVTKTDLMWEEGGFTMTDQALDFALPNSDFFMVQDRNGNTFLTRDGAFGITQNMDTGDWELVNGSGEFVLDYEGGKIVVPFETEDVLDEEGNVVETITTTNIDYNAVEEMIGVYSVANNWGLEQASNNHFVVTARSGEAVANPASEKVRMALEMSTTDLAGDMVHIIETQRAYQLAAKIIQTADEFARIANTLRG